MAAYTKKLLAKDVVITVVPLTESGGTFSEGTAFSFTGRAGRVTRTRRKQLERLDADDSDYEHSVPVKKGFTLTLEAIKHVSGTDLEDISEGYDFVKVTIAKPRGSQTKTDTYYGAIEEDNWDKEIGKNLDRLTIVCIDIGTANPAIVTA